MKAFVLSLGFAIALACLYGPAAYALDDVNQPLPEAVTQVAINPDYELSNWGKAAALLIILGVIALFLFIRPRRLKPGSYRFIYPSTRNQRRPRSSIRR